MKTNKFDNSLDLAQEFEMGQVPYLFKQKVLTRLTGETLRPGGLMLTKRAVEVCDFDRDDPVLDAGCGYGMTARYLRERHGIMSVGTDAALDMMNRNNETKNHTSDRRAPEKASESILPRVVQPLFLQSRLPEIPFKSKSFSGIFCECVLSLIPDKPACLGEFFRILKKNGKLVLTDLYIPELAKTASAPGEAGKTPVSCLDGAVTVITLIKLLEAAGFQVDIIEDHTRLLRQLAGQMVFEHGSLDNFWERLSGTICDTGVSRACRAGHLKPGYCMVIAGKYE